MHANTSAEPANAALTDTRTDAWDAGPHGSGWHDDLLGGSWTSPGVDLEDDEAATIREIESLIGELVAELEA